MNKRWILPVKQNDSGELYIELNDEILEGSGFQIGDTLDWKDNHDGSFSLTRVDKDIYMVEAISIFHLKFAVRAKSAEHAMDEVVCDDGTLKEFSQKHVDVNIINTRKVTMDQYLEEFDKDNEYLSSWSPEQKLAQINDINYESN